jgi:fibrillarin-like rRNA methylase
MVAFGVHLAGGFQHVFRAEMNAQLASFAAIRDQVDLAPWDADFIHVERLAIENFH